MYKILYVHGLGSGADSRIPCYLREHLGNEYDIYAPEIPFEPYEAIEFIDNLLLNNHYDLAIGSSLGAFYLMKAGSCTKRLLINPAAKAGHYIEEAIGYGEFSFSMPRANGDEHYEINRRFISELKEMELEHDEESEGYMRCYVSPEDELFGDINPKICRQFFLEENIIPISGPHSVPENVLSEIIIPDIPNFIASEVSLPPIYMYGLDSNYMSPEIFD